MVECSIVQVHYVMTTYSVITCSLTFLVRNNEGKRKDENLHWVEVASTSSKHTVMNIMINSTVNRIVIQIVLLKLNITLIM